MASILQVLSSPVARHWLYHLFGSASLSVLLTHYSERHIYNKIMPYLRGSKTTRTALPPTLPNRVKRLEVKVARNAPSTEHHLLNVSYVNSGSGANIQTTNVTNSFATSAEFRDKILGDSFFNKGLQFRMTTTRADCERMRMIIYIPKRQNGTWAPDLQFAYTEIPDPAEYTVLFDKVMLPKFGYETGGAPTIRGTYLQINGYAKSKSKVIIDDGNIQRNPMKVALVWDSTTAAASTQLRASYNYHVVNK